MKKKLLPEETAVNNKLSGYYPLLFILSFIWMIYYTPVPGGLGIVSFIAQQAILFSLLIIADIKISGKKLRYTLAGISAIYIFLLHFNALLLSITSMTLYESIAVLATGGDFIYTLEETGLPAAFIPLIAVILLLIASIGGSGYRFIPRKVLRGKATGVILILIFSLSSIFFITEQIINRNTQNFFSRRVLPLYIEIFSTNNDSATFTIPAERIPGIEAYSNVSRPGNPKNVLFIILESFRSDAVNAELSPFMNGQTADSPVFTNYYTDAIYTSLAWNTLLMNRPAYTFTADVDYDSRHNDGSGIFRIFKKAGYESYVVFSANMEWKNFHKRVNGKDKLIDNYFCGYERRDEERNFIDNRTTSKSAEWIKEFKTKTGRTIPFFMMVQLDSTHWTYFADRENELSKPFAPKDVNIAKLKNKEDIELLLNRYKNSVRQVNSGIAKIINTLKENGIYNNTAIIIVSDHGEGFAPGMIGHSVMHDDIKKPAFIMNLPGIKKFKTDDFISHKDVFPTIFDYLKIKGTGNLMQGKSILNKNRSRESVLSFHGSLMMADLTFKNYIVFFRVKICKESIIFTPVRYTDREGNILKNYNSTEWKKSLKQIIETGTAEAI